MNRRYLYLVFALLVLILPALIACDSGASSPVQTDKVSLPPSYRFEPKTIEVKAGTTVTWTNNDNFTHSVKLDGSPDGAGTTASSETMKPGQSATITFNKPGEYTYTCTYHPQDMKGKVIVTAP